MARTLQKTFTMFRGDDRELPIIVAQPYHASAKIQFAAKLDEKIEPEDNTDANAVVQKDITTSVDNGDGRTKFVLVLAAADTKDKPPGEYVAEIEYVSATGKHTTAEQFILIIEGDVNQR